MNIELHTSDLLNFVEFNITGDNDNYHRCDVESRYLESSVFYLFQLCFENANPTFDYFSGTKYNARKIIVLRNDLLTNLRRFEEIISVQDFRDLISDRFMGLEFLAELGLQDRNWEDRWDIYNQQIIRVNKDLIDLAEKCAYDERVLWVIGY
jgi:hypothetical protein